MTMRNLKHVLTIALITMAALGVSISSRALQNYAQTPVSDGTLRRLRVPILMYHYVSELPANADELRRGLTVTPQQFGEHLDYLKTRQYTSVSLYEISLALTQGYRLPDQPVALTFDDGYKEHLTTVAPALRERGLTGTFFIITGNADNQRHGYLTWDEINQIASQGMIAAAVATTHGATHTSDKVLELRRLRVQNTTGVPGLEVLLLEK